MAAWRVASPIQRRQVGPTSCSAHDSSAASDEFAHPALDGIRAISICFVLCAHSLGTGILPMISAAHAFADIGVRFVLRAVRVPDHHAPAA